MLPNNSPKRFFDTLIRNATIKGTTAFGFGRFYLPLIFSFILLASFISCNFHKNVIPGFAWPGISLFNLLASLIIICLLVVVALKNKRLKLAEARAFNFELRFKKLYDSGMIGLLFTNLDGKVMQANRAFLDILGYSQLDLDMGKINLNNITPSEFEEVTNKSLMQLRGRGLCMPFEKEFIRKDGERVKVMLGSSLLDQNDFAEVVSYVIDVSYKKQIEQREQQLNNIIKKQREELMRILMHAPAIISIRRGPDFKLEFANKASQDFLKTSSSKSMNMEEAAEKLKVDLNKDMIEQVYRTGESISGKSYHLLIDRNGNGAPEDFWFDFVIEPVYDDQGKIDGVASFGFDVSDMIKANNEVKESEIRFRFLADAIPHKMWTANNEGRATYFNKGWYDYTGILPFEDMSEKIWGIIHPDDLMKAHRLWKISLDQAQDLEMEQRFMNQDGEYLWHLTRMYAHKDEEGRVLMWVGTSTNIHEQKMALEALKVSEEHFKALANNNSLIIWQVDPMGQVTYVNDTWITFTGLAPTEGLTMMGVDAIHPDDRIEAVDAMRQGFFSQQPFQLKFRFRNTRGEYRWVLNYANPIFNPEFAGYIASMTDINDQELAQKATKMLLRKRDEFLGIASHELKTPLTSMKASLQILDKLSETDFKPENVRGFIGMANKQVKKLTGIVEDLLDVTKIQSGKMLLNLSEYVFADSVQDCINEMQQYTDGHQLIVEKKDLVTIIADRTRVEQVIVNLLSNAIKYSPGKDSVILKIEKDSLNNNLHFSVRDFGIGIPTDKQSFIFDRFFRVHESSQNFSGLGLGLYISSEIINRHGGKVGMESEEGKGSTFWFTLPIKAQ